MNLDNFRKPLDSKTLAENIEKQFAVGVDLTKYSREQLEDARNKIRTRIFQHEGNSKINELLTNEEYQKDKAMLELLNTRIKEMLGEQMKNLLNKIDQLNEAKKAKKADKDYDGDGKIESPKDEVWGSRAKAAAKSGKPFGKKDKKVKEEKVDEKAVSKAQQQAAGIALAAKEKGKKPAGKGAAAAMAKMPKKELKKFAKTSHKGLPKHKKAEEGVDKELDEYFSFPKPKHSPPDVGGGLAKRPKGAVAKSNKHEYGNVVKGDTPYSIEKRKPKLPEAEKLLPGQKDIADRILKKDMEDTRAARRANRQAGTPDPTMPPVPSDKVLRARAEKMFRENVKTVNESLEYLLREDEEGKAKAITAAGDMVNDFTSWMQRVGQYQTKSMIELADAIRADFGQQESETFKAAVGPALAATLEVLTQQREVLSQAVAVLAGEAAPAAPMGAEPAAPVEPGIDATEPDALNTPDELDAFAASDAAAGAGTTGREVRESVEERKARLIAEQHSIIARLAK
jgi:hypothetical protein